MTDLADKVIALCRELARCSDEPGCTTRTFLSPPMRDVHRILGDRMRALAMQVHIDAAGNLRGLHGDTRAPRLMIASHLDTVPNAGAFDGILGVVLGIALVELQPRMPIEVVGFSEEEGVRFGMPFIGSRALAGTLDASTLAALDRNGISVGQALLDYGLDPAQLGTAGIAPEVIGYLEFHIEQGPVLDHAGLACGVVDAINGQSRLTLAFEGTANHAGTTPMTMRRDALAAAAEWITSVESVATSEPGLVATVGSVTVSPNAGNVIAGSVRASLDVRHASDDTRHRCVQTLLDSAASIAATRGITVEHRSLLDQPAVAMDRHLTDALARAARIVGQPPLHLNSGAGHDAMILAPCVPSAMMFLRSPGGISHHPDEAVLPDDVAVALAAGQRFIAGLEADYV